MLLNNKREMIPNVHEETVRKMIAIRDKFPHQQKGGGEYVTTKTSAHNTIEQRKSGLDGLDETNKHRGVFKATNDNQLPCLKSIKNSNGLDPPPTVTVGGKVNQKNCVKGSTVDRVCNRDQCKFAHLLDLAKITTETYALNQWIDKIPNFT